MAIQDGDIKLLKAKVMADVPEGGGGPTGQVVEWGKSNQVFEDVTEVARAGGQVSIRQLHAAVSTNDTAPLLDANIVIDQLVTDPNVSVTIAACDTFAKRSEIATAIASYLIAGTEWAGILLGNHVKGQGNVQIFHRPGSSAPPIGRTLVLVQDEGLPTEVRQYVRITRTDTVERTFTYITSSGEAKDYQALVTTCEIGSRLEQAFRGSEPSRAFTREVNATRLRDTTVADAMQFYGAAPMTAAYTLGDASRQVKVSSIYTQLVPSSRTERVNLEQRPAAMRTITLATGPREVTVGITPHTKRFTVGQENRGYSWTSILRPFPSPGTVVVSFMVLGTWYSCQDDGTGVLAGDGAGTVNYATGSIAMTLPALPDVGSAILIQWGETTGFVNRSGSAATVRQPEFALQLPHKQLKRGSVTVSWTSGGVTKTLADAVSGNALSGSGGTGLINHASGQILIRPTAWMDAGGQFLVQYRRSTTVTHSVPAPAVDAAGYASIVLPTTPAPGSVELRWITVRSVTASSGASSGGSSARKNSSDYASSYGNGYISQSSQGWSTSSQRINQTQDRVEHTLHDDGSGGLYSRGNINYGTRTITAKLVDLDSSTSAYQSDYEKSSSFESQSGPGRTVGVGGSGSSMRGGSYSLAGVSEQVLAASTLQVTYAESFDTTFAESYSWTPPELYIDLCPMTEDYVVPGTVQFTWLGHTYIDVDGDLIRDRTSTSPGVVCGRMDYEAGMAFLSDWVVSSANALVLQSLWTTRKQWTTGSVFFKTPAAPVAVQGITLNLSDATGNAITLTPDLDGYFNTTQARGRIDYQYGLVEIQFGRFVDATSLTAAERAEWWYDAADVGSVQAGKIWKPLPVDPTTLRFNSVTYAYLPLDADIIGMDPTRLPSDGRVPVFRNGYYVVVGHTGVLPAATVANGQTMDCARQRLSRVWIVGADGKKIQTGWSANLDAGKVTVTDTTAWVQPVRVYHRIEEMARVADVQINGTLTLTKALSHSFPAGSVVSSALYVGTLRARVSHLFDQANWDGVAWADSVTGNGAPAQFNDTAFPVAVTNAGAITERWVLRFATNTTVEVIGEHVGNLGTFPIASDIAPINPNTRTESLAGVPYFTIPAGGWGSGWGVQNVLRLNTVGAMQSFACIRTVQPSEAAGADYSFGLLVRGDVDRSATN